MKSLVAAFVLLTVASHGETAARAGWFLQHERHSVNAGDGRSRCIAMAPTRHLAVSQTERDWRHGHRPGILLLMPAIGPPEATPASGSAEDAGEEDYCRSDAAPALDGLGQCVHRADVEIALDDGEKQTQTLTYVERWQQLGDGYDDQNHGLAFLANADTRAIRRGRRATVEWNHGSDDRFDGRSYKGASTNVVVYDLSGLSEAYDWVIECAQTHFSGAEPH